jgi:pimeloyl-ACP methyl ester carboxylesterase
VVSPADRSAVLEVVGPEDGTAVLYFHGAASARDFGPSDDLCHRTGVRLFRFRRPGYDQSEARPSASLVDVAEQALAALASHGERSVAVLGWSGGGPYALASLFAPSATGNLNVNKVGLISSWAPMNPPHPGLPSGVRFFMKAAQALPRPLLRASLAVTGRRTVGHADDIRRVARAWGFEFGELPIGLQIVAWHATNDTNVPIEPWRNQDRVSLREEPGDWHVPDERIWEAILRWTTSANGHAST